MVKKGVYSSDTLLYNSLIDRVKLKRRDTEMATRIWNTETGEMVELQVISDGQDFLADVIGGCDQTGEWASEDMPEEAEFAMDSDDLGWWERWADREQAILDRTNELGEDAIQAICDLAGEYGFDMELLQEKEEEFLGLR